MLELVAALLFVGVAWASWDFLKAYGSLISEGAKSTARRYGIGLEEDASPFRGGLAEEGAAYIPAVQGHSPYPWIAVTAVAVAAAAGFGFLSRYVYDSVPIPPGEVEAKFASGLRVGFQVSDVENALDAIDQIKGQNEDVHYLRLEDLAISSLGYIGNLTKIESLNLDGTLIDDLSPVKHLVELQALDLGNTPFYDTEQLMYFPHLEWLDLRQSKVSDFRFLSSLNNLRSLNLEGLQIKDLSPLSSLDQLERLNLSYTEVSDLAPLRDLSRLKELKLRSTEVHDLEPLYGLSSLNSLDLSDTPIEWDQIEALRHRLAEVGNTDLEVRISPGLNRDG